MNNNPFKTNNSIHTTVDPEAPVADDEVWTPYFIRKRRIVAAKRYLYEGKVYDQSGALVHNGVFHTGKISRNDDQPYELCCSQCGEIIKPAAPIRSLVHAQQELELAVRERAHSACEDAHAAFMASQAANTEEEA